MSKRTRKDRNCDAWLMRVRSKKTVVEGIIFRCGAYPNGYVVQYEPGNCTKYIVAFLPLSHPICDRLSYQEGSVLVSWISDIGRSYPFAPHVTPAWHYVQEKLGGSESDAKALAELIGEELGRPSEGAELKNALRLV